MSLARTSARKAAATATFAATAAKAAGLAATVATRFATTTTTVATAATAVAAAQQIHRCHGGIGLTTCAAARFVAKGIDATLGAQMRIGTGLEIIFKMLGRLRVVVMRHALRGGARTALWAIASGLVAATAGMGRTAIGVRGTGWAIATRL